MVINASFLHFIFIQFLCLLFSSIAEMTHTENTKFVYFLGSALFFYAIFSVITTALTVLNVASWFDEMHRITDETKHTNDKNKYNQ